METLADLGQGFHLVPLADHCLSVAPRRWRVVVREDHFAPESVPCVGMADAYHYAATCRDRGLSARVIGPRRRKSRETARRQRDCALSICDPMALQAAIILRGALVDLRSEI